MVKEGGKEGGKEVWSDKEWVRSVVGVVVGVVVGLILLSSGHLFFSISSSEGGAWRINAQIGSWWHFSLNLYSTYALYESDGHVV